MFHAVVGYGVGRFVAFRLFRRAETSIYVFLACVAFGLGEVDGLRGLGVNKPKKQKVEITTWLEIPMFAEDAVAVVALGVQGVLAVWVFVTADGNGQLF